MREKSPKDNETAADENAAGATAAFLKKGKRRGGDFADETAAFFEKWGKRRAGNCRFFEKRGVRRGGGPLL